MTAARDSNVTGVSRVGKKRTNERKEQKLFPWMGFRSGGWERWQAEGRFFLLLKEEIILRYKITALPRCSFGPSPSSPTPRSIPAHRRRATTNTNLKDHANRVAPTRNHVIDWQIKYVWRRPAEKRIFSFYEAHLRSWPLNVTWHSFSKGAISLTRKNFPAF